MSRTLKRICARDRGAVDLVLVAVFIIAFGLLTAGMWFALQIPINAYRVELGAEIRTVVSEKYDVSLSKAQAESLVPMSRSADPRTLDVTVDGRKYTVQYFAATDGPALIQPNGKEIPGR